jgi:uncharacterized protein (TIGR00725 family)
MRCQIAVIGASDASQREKAMAEEVGRLVAARGATVVCGGLGGVMEAACRGAKKAGGATVGIVPGNEKGAANEYVDYVVATGLGHGRNVIVASSADAVIAVGGKAGTLSEIAFALLKGLTVVSLDSWKIETTRIDAGNYVIADSPAEAVEKAFEAIQWKKNRGKRE